MVIYCTNCGTKLEDDDAFCMNCGTKVDNLDKNKKKSLFQSIQDTRKKNKAKQKLENICIRNYVESTIKKQVTDEIESGQVKIDGVEKRVNELKVQYKKQKVKENAKFKLIDEILESEEIKLKIKEYDINDSQLNTIRTRVISMTENFNDKTEIKKNISARIEKNGKLNKIKKERRVQERKRNKEKNKKDSVQKTSVERIIKRLCPNLKLAHFEKEIIKKHHKGHSFYTDEEIARKIIKPHKKIGEYDFTAILVEEGGYKNAVDILGLQKRVRKESDYYTNVFIKINDNNLRMVGSELNTILPSQSGLDMTIFFTDLTRVNYSDEKIFLDLSNKTKLKLIGYYKEEKKDIKKFYNLLNTSWMNFKNNTVDSDNENKINNADELMKYAELYEKGLLTEEEFNAMKKKLLGI